MQAKYYRGLNSFNAIPRAGDLRRICIIFRETVRNVVFRKPIWMSRLFKALCYATQNHTGQAINVRASRAG